MIKAERRLLSTLGFVVHVKHPHKLIVSYIFSLKCSERKDLIQKAWSYMNDGLRTDMFLRYTPETIACSCIFLAARTVQPPIALPSSPFPWFELFDASDRDVQTIALMLQKLYTRQKTPEWNKIDAILEKMRSQKETSEKTSKAQQVAQKLTETKSVGNGKDSRDNSERDENRRERGRSRSRSRSRTPIKRTKFSPGRRRRDSPDRNGKYGRDSKGRGGKGGYRDERRDRDKRDEKRRRSRSRDRMDRDRLKERSKLREKEVYQSLGKRPRNHTPSPPSRIRK